MSTKKLAFLSMNMALAIVFAYLESFLPTFVIGLRIGIANIFVMLVLFTCGDWEAVLVGLMKVLISSLLRGNFFDVVFFMSLSGTILSLIAMVLSKELLKKLSPIGISAISSYAHVIGQLIALSIFSSTVSVFSVFPLMSALSILTGALMGYLTLLVMKNRYVISTVASFSRKENKSQQ